MGSPITSKEDYQKCIAIAAFFKSAHDAAIATRTAQATASQKACSDAFDKLIAEKKEVKLNISDLKTKISSEKEMSTFNLAILGGGIGLLAGGLWGWYRR